MDKNRLSYLTKAHIENSITVQEQEELIQYLNQTDINGAGADVIHELMMESAPEDVNAERLDKIFDNVLAIDKQPSAAPKIRRMHWVRWAAAAAILIAVVSTIFLTQDRSVTDMSSAQTDNQQRYKDDVLPAEQSVILTLADGSIVRLDSVATGTVGFQGKTEITKTASGIEYDDSEATEVVYNTVATQKGKVYQLQLPDGTRVWLDAVSSIRFPTAFIGADRRVEVTGQVYFEVAPAVVKKTGARQSFIVQAGQQDVEVLGTHFNVNTIDPSKIETTLLEGSVSVSANNSTVLLRPGQQSINTIGRLQKHESPNLEKVMAWKNGIFYFDGYLIEEVMDNLKRWYNIDVDYQARISERFIAKIERDLPVSEILKLLEMTGQVRFSVHGNTITVMK